jgi:hypothetical protein
MGKRQWIKARVIPGQFVLLYAIESTLGLFRRWNVACCFEMIFDVSRDIEFAISRTRF